jgi:hypothetical protein
VSRTLWFVAGAGAGVYAVARARRAAGALTPDGLRDRLAGMAVGAHLFHQEVRAGMVEKENELRHRLVLGLDGEDTTRRLGSGAARELTRRGTD